MSFRPTCFQLFFLVPYVCLALVGMLLVREGGWAPQGPLFRAALGCFGGAALILVIMALMGAIERWRKR